MLKRDNNAMNLLPSSTVLGQLSLYEVYDEYDGPKCFSAINSLKQLFLVYWCDYEEEFNKHEWLYAPISEKRLDSLRRGDFSIREVFKNPEQVLYLVNTGATVEHEKLDWVQPNELEDIYFPPNDFFIEPEFIEVFDRSADWFSELNISKNSKKSEFPSRKVVSNVLDIFGQLVECLMKDKPKAQPKVYPMSAVPGSFEVKLGASHNEKASAALDTLFNILNSSNDELEETLKGVNVDPHLLRELLDISNTENISLTLKPKYKSAAVTSLLINGKNLEEKIAVLEDITDVLIDSSKVPQANDIDKVIEIVEMRQRGERLNHEDIDGLTSNRQVRYYTDAAYCLGLLKKNLSVTSAGRFLISKESDESRYQVLADRFESSDFGFGWMRWSGVKAMEELDETTAYNFISTCVKGLSEDTAKRRSTTLIKWLNTLKPYRRKYSCNNEETE